MSVYHLIDRDNGCRLMRMDNGTGYITLQASSVAEAESLAEQRGFPCDWITGRFHVVNVTDELAKAGLKLK